MKTNRTYNVKAYLLMAALALVVLVLCLAAIWLGDDMYFAFNLASAAKGDWLQKIHTPEDIIKSQYVYYTMRNGRFVTHSIVQFFCGIAGKTVFAVCNAVMWMAFIAILTRVSGFNWRRDVSVLSIIMALAFVSLRTQFTPPCQVNYIWAFAAGLLTVDWFLNPRQSKVWAVPMVVFSFLAGWGQESFSSGVSAAMCIYALLHFKSMKPIQWAILCAFTAGMLFLCLAPGNFLKMGGYSSLRITPVAMLYFMRSTHVMVVLVLLTALLRKASLKQIYLDNAFVFNAMFFMGVFNLIVQVYCNRQLFGIEVMSIIIIVRLLHRYYLQNLKVRVAVPCVLAALVVLVLVEDFRIIDRRGKVLDKICSLYDQSPDGVIYCDIEDEDFFYRDQDPMWSLNYWALYQLSHMWQSEGKKNALEWRPTILKELQGQRLKSQVIKLGKNRDTFIFITAKGDTAARYRLTADRSYGPVTVVHYANSIRAMDVQLGTELIEDEHFYATIHRQNDVFIRFTDAILLP